LDIEKININYDQRKGVEKYRYLRGWKKQREDRIKINIDWNPSQMQQKDIYQN
jgi:hypothetical protein